MVNRRRHDDTQTRTLVVSDDLYRRSAARLACDAGAGPRDGRGREWTGSWYPTTWCSARTWTPTPIRRSVARRAVGSRPGRTELARTADRLTAIAATTTRIRLGTAILLAALRRPAVLAKQLATLDVLSDGRVDLGVGVGWQREEYEAAGLSFEDRGRLLDHTLEVCQTLWTQQRASYQSAELTFDGIHQMPKPVQPGGVPLWISGTVNNAVARRIARFGSGWIPWGPAYADIPGAIAAMKDKMLEFGGDPTDLQVQGVARVVKDERWFDRLRGIGGRGTCARRGRSHRCPVPRVAHGGSRSASRGPVVARSGVPRRDALSTSADHAASRPRRIDETRCRTSSFRHGGDIRRARKRARIGLPTIYGMPA